MKSIHNTIANLESDKQSQPYQSSPLIKPTKIKATQGTMSEARAGLNYIWLFGDNVRLKINTCKQEYEYEKDLEKLGNWDIGFKIINR